jgi:hypothetical protein
LLNILESYNPPEEFLFDEQEKANWQKLDDIDRWISCIPQKYVAGHFLSFSVLHFQSSFGFPNFALDRAIVILFYFILFIFIYLFSFSRARNDSLRTTPAYPKFQQERFQRCLDLYLATRSVKKRV